MLRGLDLIPIRRISHRDPTVPQQFVAQLLEGDYDILTVQELLGHNSGRVAPRPSPVLRTR